MKVRKFNKRILLITGLLVALYCFSFQTKKMFMYNLTDSVPVGMYRLDYSEDFKAGDIVAFFAPQSVADLMYSRSYISEETPLIKFIIGVESDRFCIDSDGRFSVNGMIVGTAKNSDSKGRALPHPYGCFKVDVGNFLVAGIGDASFDSRYFGQIPRSILMAKLKPVWAKYSSEVAGEDGGNS